MNVLVEMSLGNVLGRHSINILSEGRSTTLNWINGGEIKRFFDNKMNASIKQGSLVLGEEVTTDPAPRNHGVRLIHIKIHNTL
jgi:hypothetical protein